MIYLTMSTKHIDTSVGETINTGNMQGCISVVLATSKGVRAQHCSGGLGALSEDFFGITKGSKQNRAVFVGLPAGGDVDRIAKLIKKWKKSNVPYVAHVIYVCAEIDTQKLWDATSDFEVTQSVKEAKGLV